MAAIETALATVESAVAALRESVFHDDKTPLQNGLALQAELKRIAQDQNEWAVVFGDLNGFKLVNDTHGHHAGDAAINRVGSLLKESIAPFSAKGFRISGDEFVVVALRADVEALMQSLKVFESAWVKFAEELFEVRASFGWTHASKELNAEQWLEQAELACRVAKFEGAGKVVAWNPDMEAEPRELRARCTRCGCSYSARPSNAEIGPEDLACPQCGQKAAA